MIFFTFCFLVLSCKVEKKKYAFSYIELKRGFEKSIFFLLSEVAEDIEYIFLEANDSSLISDIRKVVYDYPYYYIMDSFEKSIFIFDGAGKFVNVISALGQGPREYTMIYNFEVYDGIIYILDYNLKKIFKYDINGKFINAFQVDEWVSFLKVIDNDNLLLVIKNYDFIVNNEYVNNGYVFLQYDKDFNLIRKFQPMERKGHEIGWSFHSFYRQRDTVVYWEYNIFDTVYNVFPDGHTEPRFLLIPPKTPSSLILKKGEAHLIKDGQFEISSLVETDDFVFLSCFNGRRRTPLIFYKNENRTVGIDHRLMNNMDGGIPFWPRFKFSDNKVATAMFPDEIKKFLNLKVEEYFKGFNFWEYRPKLNYDEEKHKKLLEQLEKTDDMSNPLLMIVTMKSSRND